MIGTLPVSDLAPLDYRYALDAAATMLPCNTTPLILCRIPQLWSEVQQRFPGPKTDSKPAAVLWIEPMQGTWQADLRQVLPSMVTGDLLLVVISRPLARLLPERRNWPAEALGLVPGGGANLRQALTEAGFSFCAYYGFHTLGSMALNLVGQGVARWRPDWGDRLEFAARLRYSTSGHLASLATVSLLAAAAGDCR